LFPSAIVSYKIFICIFKMMEHRCDQNCSEFGVGCNKNVDIKFSSITRFWNNLHQVFSKSKDWKTK